MEIDIGMLCWRSQSLGHGKPCRIWMRGYGALFGRALARRARRLVAKKSKLVRSDTLRCVAHNKAGQPCGAFPIHGASVCSAHGGESPQVKRRAKERMEFAADVAAKQLIEFVKSKQVPYAVRLQACRDLLDRAGLSVGTDVTVTLRKFEESIEGIFVDVVDGQVVEEEDASPAALPPGVIEDDEGDPLQQVDRSEVVQG